MADRVKGKLVSWNDDRGFGFIESENEGKNVFLHITEVTGKQRPQEGDIISYTPSTDKHNKIRASHAKIKKMKSDANKTRSLGIGVKLFASVPFFCSICFAWKEDEPLIFMTYLFFSIMTLWLYHIDKKRAKKEQWRIAEATMHFCEFLGGWPGALIAQQKIRHKNKKVSYQIMFWFIVVIHLGFWSYYFLTDFPVVLTFFEQIREYGKMAGEFLSR